MLEPLGRRKLNYWQELEFFSSEIRTANKGGHRDSSSKGYNFKSASGYHCLKAELLDKSESVKKGIW